MTTMLEKAARALSDHFKCEWETMRDDDRKMIRGYARAVLMAVREPGLEVRSVSRFSTAEMEWPRMIDAILNEDLTA